MSVNVSMAAVPAAVTDFIRGSHKLLIDGKWVATASGKTFSTQKSGRSRQTCGYRSRRCDVDLAVAAARRAFEDGPCA
jgi:phenylacetaldehyde dehydrogenase